MPRILFGLVLILAGIWLFAAGWSRKHSLAGSLAETGSEIANAFDGGARQPRHWLQLGVGTLLGAGGIALVVTSRRKR